LLITVKDIQDYTSLIFWDKLYIPRCSLTNYTVARCTQLSTHGTIGSHMLAV